MDHDEIDDTVDDFDAFWDQRERKHRRVKVRGDVITLPPSMPLQFEMEARKLQRSKADKDVRKLVGILFGTEQLERWAKRGMDAEQFMVLLAWAPRAISGESVTFAEVADELAAELAKGSDKPDPS